MGFDSKLEIALLGKDLTQRFWKNTKASVAGLTKSVFSLNAAFGALAGSSGIGYLIKRNIEAADKIAKTADKIGLTTDELQEYRYAADIAGVSQQQLDMGMQRFSRRIAEVAAGTGELKAVAERYNIQLRDSDGKMRANSAILADFADVIKGAESEQEKLRIAFKLFDSEGAALVNMLSDGGAAMNKMRQEAHDLGIVVDEDLLRNAEKVNDRFTQLSKIMQAKVLNAVVNLAPQIDTLATGMIGLAEGVAKAVEGFDMFFGLSEKGKLYNQLQNINKELADLEEKKKTLQTTGKVKITTEDITGGMPWGAPAYMYQERGKQLAKKANRQLQDPTAAIAEYDRQIAEKMKAANDILAAIKGGGGKGKGSFADTGGGGGSPAVYDRKTWDASFKSAEAAQKNFIRLAKEMAAAQKERLELSKDVTEKINVLTMNETEFKKWSLDQEVRDMKKAAGDEKNILDQIEKYHGLAVKKINKSLGQEITDATKNWAVNFSSQLNDILWDSEATFDGIAKAYGKMITQIMLEKSAMRLVDNSGDWFKMAGQWIGNYFSKSGGSTASAMGNVFAGRGINAYENKIIDRPVVFPFARGIGLMGEGTRPEAILPLTRTSSGNLGVEAKVNGGRTVVYYNDFNGATFLDQETLTSTMRTISNDAVRRGSSRAVMDDYRNGERIRDLIRNGP